MDIWKVIGFTGQSVFGSRFLVQWLHSERAKKSVIPTSFWYLSLAGTSLLLTYAIHQRDSVFIVGQAFGSVVYLRNLWLIRQQARANA